MVLGLVRVWAGGQRTLCLSLSLSLLLSGVGCVLSVSSFVSSADGREFQRQREGERDEERGKKRVLF